jgi:hypothetical protein
MTEVKEPTQMTLKFSYTSHSIRLQEANVTLMYRHQSMDITNMKGHDTSNGK